MEDLLCALRATIRPPRMRTSRALADRLVDLWVERLGRGAGSKGLYRPGDEAIRSSWQRVLRPAGDTGPRKVKVGVVGRDLCEIQPLGNNDLQRFLEARAAGQLPGLLGFCEYCIFNPRARTGCCMAAST